MLKFKFMSLIRLGSEKGSLYLFIVFALFLFSCTPSEHSESAPENLITSDSSHLISYELMKTLSLEDIETIRTTHLEQFLTGATMPFSEYKEKLDPAKYSVKLYKVTYNSVIPELGNKPVKSTGIIAIPDTETKELPLISYQHGTVFERFLAPSAYENAYEIHFMVSQFASQGYVLIAADYFGCEHESELPNSYFVEQSTVQACMDLYKASLEILEKEGIKKSSFFVNGWSQGGYNTMAFLRALERANVSVDAAFTAAAPVDPAFFVSRGFFNPRDFDADYFVAALCNIMFSVEHYGADTTITKRYIKEPYYSTAKNFYEFKITFKEFMDSVPIQFDQVFNEELFSDAKLITGPFWPVMSKSEVYKWLSSTPLKSFGGGLDDAVPDYVSFMAIDYMNRLGKKDAEAISSGAKADHRCVYIHSLITAKPWIDSFNQ
jgi:hypothetical protein